MKKTIALLLAVCMLAAFAGCAAQQEVPSQEPASEPASVQEQPVNLLEQKAVYDPNQKQVLLYSDGYHLMQADGVLDVLRLEEGTRLECWAFAGNRFLYGVSAFENDKRTGRLVSRDLKTGEETVLAHTPVSAVAADDSSLYYYDMGETGYEGRFVKQDQKGNKTEFSTEYGMEYVPRQFVLQNGSLYFRELDLFRLSADDWKQPKKVAEPNISGQFRYALAPEGVVFTRFDEQAKAFAVSYQTQEGRQQTLISFEQLEDQKWLGVYDHTAYLVLKDVLYACDLQTMKTKELLAVPNFQDAAFDETGALLISSKSDGTDQVVRVAE